MSDIRDFYKTVRASWHREIVDDLKICRAQAFQATRDSLPNRSDDKLSPDNWIGPLCEEVFHRWLDSKGLDHEWDHEPDRFDDVEFYRAPHNIDVKGMNQNADCEPLPHYACNVKKKQAEKRDSRVTAYCFSRFIKPTKEVIQFGMISRADFLDCADEGEQDEQVTGDFKVKTPVRFCKISDLTPTEEFLAGRTCVDCGHWNGFMDGQLCGPCWMARRAKAKGGARG